MRYAALMAVLFILQENPATKPTPRDDTWWKKRHQECVAEARKGEAQVVFLGDSITHFWSAAGKKVWAERFAPLKAVNFGFSADRTEHVLWRIKDGTLDGLKPKAVVLLIGVNNLGARHGPENTFEGVQSVVKEIREKLPGAKILLLGAFPWGAKADDPARDLVKKLNERTAKLDDGNKVRFLDIGEKFLEKDGSLSSKIMPDFLHLSKKGYQIWADAIEGALKDLVGPSEPVPQEGKAKHNEEVVLESADGKIEGTHLTYVEAVDCIACWANPKGKVKWSFTAPKSGAFTVVVTCVHGHGPSQYVVTVGDQEVAGAIVERGADPDWYDYVDEVLGDVDLVKGQTYPVTIKATSMPNGSPMNLRCITLRPVKNER